MPMSFKEYQHLSPQPVIGVDEAGRGCLAGRVYAAAVILNENLSHENFVDSKKLSHEKREIVFEEISKLHQCSVAYASLEEIEEKNILWASMLAMKRAVLGLKQNVAHVIVDGNRLIPDLPKEFAQTPMVKGDLYYRPIAAASICAKVSRDRYMLKMAEKYPQYEFDLHKGYATPRHKQLIADFGVSDIHRKTFAGVREHLRNTYSENRLER